jgi:hypothetical protein
MMLANGAKSDAAPAMKNAITQTQRALAPLLFSPEFLLVNFHEGIDEGNSQHIGDKDGCHRPKEGYGASRVLQH